MLLDFGNIICPPDWVVNETGPAGYARIYSVFSGTVWYQDPDTRFALIPGYLYIFPSSKPYGMRHDIHNPLDCTFLHYDFFPLRIREAVAISLSDTPVLDNLFSALTESIRLDDRKIILALSDLAALYFREHRIIDTAQGLLAPVLDFISNHAGEKLPLDRLSRYAGYNTQYFIRLFRREFGITPHQYVLQFRIKQAQRLLRSGQSISRIAEQTGYPDVKSFSRSFRKHMGISPSCYRETYKTLP